MLPRKNQHEEPAMVCTDPYAFLSALIAKDQAQAHARKTGEPQSALVVTLSRDCGAGGEQIAQQLSQILKIPIHDRHILELAARKSHMDPSQMDPDEERGPSAVSSFIYGALTGNSSDLHNYRRALFEAVLELAQHDGLLMGRGAHLVLAGRKAFRVRIVGSRLNCARRLADELGISLDSAERKVYEINTKRHRAIERLFHDSYEHCGLAYAKNFDLIINTDHIAPDHAVPIILLAMQQAGYSLHGHQSGH
jgi:hypothetical protein